MNKQTLKAIALWVLAVVVTISAAIYQKSTGPTYPKKGRVTIGNEEIKYKLERTNETIGEDKDSVQFKIHAKNPETVGTYTFRRYSSYDNWTTMNMIREGEDLIIKFPRLKELAGKIEYTATLKCGTEEVMLVPNNETVKMRFKGHVPWYILIPHILCMFFGLLLTTRTSIEALFNGDKVKILGLWAIGLLTMGGLILGPIVQKYAFDAYWTGWPFGGDLTDNKTLAMVVIWIPALYFINKAKNTKMWAVIATLVVWTVYLIPHSARGSEYDYTKDQKVPTAISATPSVPEND
jgi:hypothetical protein